MDFVCKVPKLFLYTVLQTNIMSSSFINPLNKISSLCHSSRSSLTVKHRVKGCPGPEYIKGWPRIFLCWCKRQETLYVCSVNNDTSSFVGIATKKGQPTVPETKTLLGQKSIRGISDRNSYSCRTESRNLMNIIWGQWVLTIIKRFCRSKTRTKTLESIAIFTDWNVQGSSPVVQTGKDHSVISTV